MNHYNEKAVNYFSNARTDIDPLLPEVVGTVLEIGCSSGGTLEWLRDTGRSVHTCGIELMPQAAAKARQSVDELFEGDADKIIQEMINKNRQFDLILCLDVLEHLIDPWGMVLMLQKLVAPTGMVIASIPNVRNIDAVLPLVFKGRWAYTEEGILDKTHMRFFTRESALELMRSGEFEILKCIPRFPHAQSKRALINNMTFGLLSDFLAIQYLISSRPRD
jgi:2-polyprenyl-3-methyl-5-hydroxy-6-metoxy-1,4-benzoquinol methylase